MESFMLKLTVFNYFGGLNRISGVFTKRTCNISDLEVHPAGEAGCSRMTIVASGDHVQQEQILKNLRKLYDVCSVEAAEQ